VARGPGTTQVLAMAGLGLDRVTVEVTGRINRLEVLPGSLTLTSLGETGALAVRGLDSRGDEVPLPGAVSWSSRDERVVTVDAGGESPRGPPEMR
jgi:hypothetical protein